MPSLPFEQVAVVRSPIRRPADMPGGGVVASIEVDPRFEVALEGIERSSHLIVVGYFHEAGAAVDEALTLRHVRTTRCGAFATRCPDRPNPIAVTVARLIGRTGLTLRVDHVDLVDRTPVLDLKPYVPGWDGVFSARRRRRVRQAEVSRADLYGFLSLDLENHLGPDAARPDARTALAAVMVAVEQLAVEPRDERLAVSVNRCDATTDALMGLLGATLGSGRVVVRQGDGAACFRFTAGTRVLELYELDDTARTVAAMPTVLAPLFGVRAFAEVGAVETG